MKKILFYFLILKDGEFLNKQIYIAKSLLNETPTASANISLFEGYLRGSTVTVAFTINITASNINDQKIATLTNYKPLVNVLFEGFTRQDKYFYR